MLRTSTTRPYYETANNRVALSLVSKMRDLVGGPKAELKPSSAMFWVVLVIAVGIMLIGARFVLAPQAMASLYGVPAAGSPTYVWAIGLRDIVTGFLFLALLWSRANRRLIGTLLYVAAVVPIGDLFIVSAGAGASSALLLHGAGAAVLLVVATMLRR
jgi:uncharacterized protein DUF4267